MRAFASRTPVVVVLLLLIALPASAAKKAKKTPTAEAATPEPAVPKEQPAPPPAPPREAPAPERESWSAVGGATMNGGTGLRALAFAGNHTFGDGWGYGGLDALYYVGGTGKNVDFGVGLRFGAWPLGLAPQAELRVRLVQSGIFHMALQVGVSVPLSIRGMIGGFTYAFQAEPGLLFSFFAKENIEIYLGVLVPGTLLFSGLYIPVPQIGFTGRAGFVYTFMKPGIGLVFSPEVTPGFYAPFGAPTVVGNIANNRVAAGFLVAFNVKLGLQVRF